MTTVKPKRFANVSIRKISGGKDPLRIIEEFITKHSHDAAACERDVTPDSRRWMMPLEGESELEILLEGLRKPQETTIYLGVNVCLVPVRGSHDVLAAALEVADGLIGIKVSLVGHYLVLSASSGAMEVSVDDLDYTLKLILAQQPWFNDALVNELGLAQALID